jgi:hypothetical protein
MRFDSAVFLAPHPRASTTTTRRAFLLAGGSFILGASVGGACGYSAGVRTANIGAGAARELDLAAGLAATGDADLDELRQLAIQAPLAELVERQVLFLDQVRSTYHADTFLWYGVARLVEGAVSASLTPATQRSRQRLIQLLDGMDPAVAPANGLRLRDRLGELRRSGK